MILFPRTRPATAVTNNTHRPPPQLLSLLLLLLLLLYIKLQPPPFISSAHATCLPEPLAVHKTRRDDIIGFYALHPNSYLAVSNASCPLNLSVSTFFFQPAQAPDTVDAPKQFNIQIQHSQTSANGKACESSGRIHALTDDHPYVSDRQAIIRTWAGAGNSARPVPWLNGSRFVNSTATARNRWVIGYDFGERSCLGTIIKPAAYLWFQPSHNVFINDFQLTGDSKYLILTFNRPWQRFGCIYSARAVGGQPPYGPGPLNDPTDSGKREENAGDIGWSPTPIYTPLPTANATADGDDQVPGNTTVGNSTMPPSTSVGIPLATTTRRTVFSDADEEGEEEEEDQREQSNTKSSASCFPALATLSLVDGSLIPMHVVNTGSKVQVSHNLFSHVFLFSHRVHQSGTVYPFRNITTATGASIVLSHGHYLRLSDGRLVAAAAVRPSVHAVMLANGKGSKVAKVADVMAEGLYAPHTIHGDIVVDGIMASTYTTAVHPALAHWLLTPVRMAWRLGWFWPQRWLQDCLRNGAPRMASWLPSGPQLVSRW